MSNFDLERFVSAQSGSYDAAIAEIRAGRKRSHWMWYIFPQMKGLGVTPMSKLYGISGIEEATAYLNHEVLGRRLREAAAALMSLQTNDSVAVFGGIDSMKLRSSMTLFDIASPDDIFAEVLKKYFNSLPDPLTKKLLGM